MASTFGQRLGAAILAFAAGAVTKADGGGGIWGGEFTTFMGMLGGDQKGPAEVTDNQQDYGRARTAESYVYTCEQVRGRAISQVPLKVWETDAQGKRQSIEHDALGVLEETNPYGFVDGVPALMRMTESSLDIHGRSAWRLAFNRKKTPSEIYWTIPTAFAPLPDKDKFFGGIRYRDEDGVRDIPPEELCYFTSDNPLDPLLGTSKIAVLKNPINLRAYSQWNNIDFFKNSMRPDWMLSGSFSNSEDNIARIRRGVRRMLSGANNRAPLILGEGMQAHLLTTSHEDAQWVEQQRLAQEEVSAVFGVPLIYLNNLERATYDNIKTAKLILWHDTMIPDCDDLADRLNRRYLWRFWPDSKARKYTFGFDYDAIEGLGEDLALIWERVVSMSKQFTEQVKNRELTPHQARALRGQLLGDLGIDTTPFDGQIPGGDTFHENINFVPIDQLSVQSLMDVWAMRGQNPEFVESVPGAPNAGNNADDVRDRLNTLPQMPPGLPPGGGDPGAPGAPPALPPGPKPPAPSAPPPPKGVDLEELKAQAFAEMRQEVERTVGEAAVRAFGDALKGRETSGDNEQLKKRLKRFFQDQELEARRTIRHARAADTRTPSDLYAKRIYEDRLAELLPVETATAVEAATQSALRGALRGNPDNAMDRVAAVFREAIHVRADALATGKADPATEPQPPLRDQFDQADAAHAEEIRGVLVDSVDADDIARQWEPYIDKADGDPYTEQAKLLAQQIAMDLSPLVPVLQAIYGDAWLLGIGSALKLLDRGGYPVSATDGAYARAASMDWSAWQPGNAAAADQLAGQNGGAGLKTLLDQADIAIRGLADTTLSDIAGVLADGARAGDTWQKIAADLRDMLDDPGRASRIARTELARGVSAASLDTYRFNGIQGKGWIASAPCPVCARNVGAILPLNSPFPSGDQMPPAHPHCRCALSPETLAPGSTIQTIEPIRTEMEAPSFTFWRKEALYNIGRRSKDHDHSTEAGETPVIIFDLHNTLTPSRGFTALGQPGSMLPPFPGVKEGLDLLVAGGCCLHLATAALSPYHIPDVLTARRKLIDGYFTAYGLPISLVVGKVPAHLYYDDRTVGVVDGDWDAVMKRVLQKLAKRFDVDKAGIWRRKDIPQVGSPVEEYPDPATIAPDIPRGLSNPVFDVDLHRCLFEASSSKLEDKLKSGALDAVRQIYNAGYVVNLSCAGWDPSTHTPQESAERLASLRRQVRSAGVPYDEMVSKDHPDVAVDDKGLEHTTWKADLPMILQRLSTPYPEDEITRAGPAAAP